LQTPSVEERAADLAALPATPAIHTEGLVKRYGSIAALDGLSMTVPRGEVFGFLGPNGAGKTTAVKLLVGLAHPTAGEAWVLGAPIGDREARRKIGYLPELFRYQDWLQAEEVLALHCELAGIPRSRRRAEIAAALELVGLTDRAGDRVGTFSKGMQQRLGLGVALLGAPDLVLLDEPTSALDPVGRHDVRELIRSLRARGTTVFLNSHLLTEVEQVCDRVAVVDRGKVIALGTMDELRGGETLLSLRMGNVSAAALETLRRAGTLTNEADKYTLQGISREAVPALVACLVELRCAIYAVEPRGQSLEDRFLELLGGNDAGTDRRAPHDS
jgi:ABC-2 type transport system ATP-binding protein